MKDTERKRGRKGEGSIRLAKANAVVNAAKGIFRWEIRVPVKRPGEPSVTRSKTFVGTEHQAHAERRRWQAELETTGVVTATTTFGHFLSEFLQQIDRRVLLGEASPGTAGRYKALADNYIRPRWGKVRASQMSEGAVEKWYEDLRDPRHAGLSRASIKLIHSVMRGAAQHAQRAGAVQKNFLVGLGFNTARKERVTAVGKSFTKKEAAEWLQAAREEANAGPLIFSLLTGVRIGEALALRWSDVDLNAGTVHVQRTRSNAQGGVTYEGATKTDSSNRVIHLSADSLGFLNEAKANSMSEYVFVGAKGGPMRPEMPGRIMKRVCDAAGVPQLRVHDLRHTHASLLLSSGKPLTAVSKHLGHASPAITLRVYSHALVEDLQSMDIGLSLAG